MCMNSHNNVGDIRQTGMINAVEMVKDKHKRIHSIGKKEEELKLINMLLKIMYY